VEQLLLNVQQLCSVGAAEMQLRPKSENLPLHLIQQVFIDIKNVVLVAKGKHLLPDIEIHETLSPP